MDKRNLTLGGIAVATLIAAGAYYLSRPSAQARMPGKVCVNCACLACREFVEVDAKITDPKPYPCPKCGQRAAYPLLVCRDCGACFVPTLEHHADGEFPQMPMVPACPKCGSRNVGAYVGTEPVLADRLILPKWPQ